MHIETEYNKVFNPPSIDYFRLETELFGSIFKICPKNYDDFKSRFRRNYYLTSLYDDARLIGFASLDEIIKSRLYYLRILCVKESYWNKGLAREILNNSFESIQLPEFTLSFTTQTFR